MALVILLIALLVERMSNLGQLFKRFVWFDRYQRRLQAYSSSNGLVGLLLIILPLVIVVFLINLLLASFLYGILSLVFSLLVVFHCFGEGNLRHEVDECLTLVEQDKEAEAKEYFQKHFSSLPPEQGATKDLIHVVFKESHQRIFAIVLWFVLLGPAGAVLYRGLERMSTYYHLGDEQRIYKLAAWCACVLDWIPVRLLAFTFALIGHFTAVFPVWLKSIRFRLSAEYDLLAECGSAALSLTDDAKSVIAQVQLDSAFGLVNRALLVWLVVIALTILI